VFKKDRCVEHYAEYKKRSDASHDQPKCQCGACAPLGDELCRRCREQYEQRQHQVRRNRFIDELMAEDEL
jgi:hypothetical protein